MEEIALPGFQLEDVEPRLIARVYVDTDLPHLDRPLTMWSLKLGKMSSFPDTSSKFR